MRSSHDEGPIFEKFRRTRRHGHHVAQRTRLIPPGCNGKKSYKTKEKAEHTRLTLINSGKAPELYIYRCPHCFFWHLTHQKQRPRRKRHGR